MDKSYLKNGFTLVELLVSLTLFSFLIFISLGSFLSILNGQRKASSLQISQDNLRFSFEFMSREIIAGNSYYCGVPSDPLSYLPQDCVSGDSSFTFRNAEGKVVIYRISGGQLERVSVSESTTSLMSSPDVIFKSLAFYVFGAQRRDQRQPKVIISAEVEAGESGTTKSVINLQTTVSQRTPDS